MLTRIKSRFTFLVLGLAAGMVLGSIVATGFHLANVSAGPPPQGVAQLRGSPAPIEPPGLQELNQRAQQVGNPPAGMPTREQLEAVIARGLGGPESIQQARGGIKGKPLPGTAQPVDPPGLQELNQRLQQVGNPPAGRPTREELLQRIPPAAIQKAQQGRPQASNRGLGKWLASLNPFRPASVLAQATTRVADFNNALYYSSPYAQAVLYGTYVYYYTKDATYQATWENTITLSDGTSTRMYALFNVQVPSDGWYIVGARAVSYANVKIAHVESGVNRVIATVPQQPGWANYPTLQYLTAGYHTFYFVSTYATAYGNGSYFYVDLISITPY